jgi:hypothetical protein
MSNNTSSSHTHIIKGMDAIVNRENIKPGVDLKELERRLINGGVIQGKQRDPTERFTAELQEAAKKMGISFGDTSTNTTSTNESNTNTTSTNRSNTNGSNTNGSQNVNDDSDDDYFDNRITGGVTPSTFARDQPRSPVRSPVQSPSGSPLRSPSGSPSGSPPRSPIQSPERYNTNYPDSDLRSRTLEQERRHHIDSVLGGNRNEPSVSFSLEKEKREDQKSAMLAEIDSLYSSLIEEDIDLSRIPRVDQKSSYEDVETVLRMLRHKNDHTRYCTFAEEFMLFGAFGLEELFNGQNTYFGRYQPDLTGYSNHMMVKLRRMRHDTGQIVSSVMQDYNIGPGARILLELIPSMVIYSKTRKQQHDQPTLYSDAEMAQASHRIRENS